MCIRDRISGDYALVNRGRVNQILYAAEVTGNDACGEKRAIRTLVRPAPKGGPKEGRPYRPNEWPNLVTASYISRAPLDGAVAARLRGTGENPWDEYGTTTGRPRRVGWLDLPILRHARRVNSLSDLVLTKLDILSGLDEIPVCVGYELDGRRVDSLSLIHI